MKYLGTVLSVFALDECIKQYVDKNRRIGESTQVGNTFLVVEKFYNQGASLSLCKDHPEVVTGMHIFAMGALSGVYLCVQSQTGCSGIKLALSLMMGGGFSNLWDRIHKHHVVDYVRFRTPWKKFSKIVFNISDFAIFLGAILTIVFAPQLRKKQKAHHRKATDRKD